MSGTQGRFPPAMQPPDPRLNDPRLADPRLGDPRLGDPRHGAPVNWPPAIPQPIGQGAQHGQQQTGFPPQHQTPPQFPPRFQAQPPAVPGPGYADPGYQQGHQSPAYGHPAQQQSEWAPAPPPSFPGQGVPRTGPPTAPPMRHPDPASYDLGNFGLPGNMPPPAPQRQPSGNHDPRMQPGQPGPGDGQQWHQPQPNDAYGYQQQPAPAHFAPGAQGGLRPSSPAPFAVAPPSQQTHDQQGDGEYDDSEYEEEKPRRSRRMLITLALIGSIGAGGGMAYAYKHFLGAKRTDQDQVVRAPREPVKSSPSDRGGRQMPNTNSAALNNRLPSEGSLVAAGGDASGVTDPNGVRRVQTVATTGREPPSVPGLVMAPTSGGFPSPGGVPMGQGQQFPPPQRQAAVPIATVPAAAPQTAARAPLPPREISAQPAADAAVPAEPKRQKLVARDPAAPAAEKAKATGVVAVLGYRRSQLDAMKAMADIQQRYEVLRDKKLEILQSDETGRGLGVIYRIVVGPRGAMGAAREVCTQLTQAGMPAKDCYTLAY